MQKSMRIVMMMLIAILWMALAFTSMSWAGMTPGTDPKGDPIQPVSVTISRSVCPPTESGYGSLEGWERIQVRIGPAQRFGLGYWSQLYGCGGISANMALDQPDRAEFFLGSNKPHGSGDLYVDPGCEIPGANNTISWPRQRTIAHDPNMPNGFVQHWVSNYNPLPTWPSDLDALAAWASPAHLYHFDWGQLRPEPDADITLTEKSYLKPTPGPSQEGNPDTIFLYRTDLTITSEGSALEDCGDWNGRGDLLLTRLRPGRFTRAGFTPPAGNPEQSPPIDIRMHNLNPWDDAVMAGLPVFFEPQSADAPASGSHVSNAPDEQKLAQVTLDPLYEPRRTPYRIIGAGFGFPLVAGTLHTIVGDICVVNGNTCQRKPAGTTIPVYIVPAPTDTLQYTWINLSATWWDKLTEEEQGAQSAPGGQELPHPKGLLSSFDADHLQNRLTWRVTQPAGRPGLLKIEKSEIVNTPFRRVIPHAMLNISRPGLYEVELVVNGDNGDQLVVDRIQIWSVQADLNLLAVPGQPDGEPLKEKQEDDPGKVLVMNFDDDDCDGQGYRHGEADVISDLDDPDGVVPSLASAPECSFDGRFPGDNDLVAIKLRPISGPDAVWLAGHAQFVLEFDNTNVALWRHQTKRDPAIPNATEAVEADRILSQETSFPVTEETTVWVEGRVPHGNTEGTRITLKLIVDGERIPWVEDAVKVIVADPIFVMLGVAPVNQGEVTAELMKLLNTGDVWEPEAIWLRGYQSATTPIAYSIAFCQDQKKCEQWFKIGLQTENSVVVFDGHANFGLGPAFEKESVRSITDFVNAGRDVYPTDPDQGGFVSLDWDDLTDQHGGTPFRQLTMIDVIPYLPRNYRIAFINVEKFPNTANPSYNPLGYYVMPGNQFRLFTGDERCFTHPQECQQQYFAGCQGRSYHGLCHYVMPHIGVMGNEAKILIVETGSDDIPALSDLKYKTLFMRACNSGRHFIETFQHGVYLYTSDETASIKAPAIFLQAILDGKTPDEIKEELNTQSGGTDQKNKIFEYYQF